MEIDDSTSARDARAKAPTQGGLRKARVRGKNGTRCRGESRFVLFTLIQEAYARNSHASVCVSFSTGAASSVEQTKCVRLLGHVWKSAWNFSEASLSLPFSTLLHAEHFSMPRHLPTRGKPTRCVHEQPQSARSSPRALSLSLLISIELMGSPLSLSRTQSTVRLIG